MNTPDAQKQIDAYALAYKKLTGIDLSHRGVFDHRQRSWFEFIKAGFTIQDLETVILWLKKGIRDTKRNPGCLRFSNLIERPDLFSEELGMANAENRNAKPAPTPRERVVAQARPVAVVASETKNTARPIAWYIEQMRKAAE